MQSIKIIFLNKLIRGRERFSSFYNGLLFYSDLKLDKNTILVNRRLRSIDKIFIFILSILSLVVFAYLGFDFFLKNSGDFRAFYSDLKANWLISPIGLLLIYLMLLIYRVFEYTHTVKNIRSKVRVKDESVNHENISKRNYVEVYESFDLNSRKVVEEAYLISLKYGFSEIPPAILLISLFTFSNEAKNVLYRVGLSSRSIIEKLFILVAKTAKTSNAKTSISEDFQKIIIESYIYAYDERFKNVSPAFLLKVALNTVQGIEDLCLDLNIKLNDLNVAIDWVVINKKLRNRYLEYSKAGRLRSKHGLDRALTSSASSVLNQYGVDVTRQAQIGLLDMIVGRNDLLNEMYRIFESGNRNLVFVGKQGVGKSAIINLLAEKIVGNDVPEYFSEKRVVLLQLSSLVAGATPAIVQQRLLQALGDAARATNVIIAIDNLEEFVGISDGGMDVSDVLAEVMEKNILYFITTVDEDMYDDRLKKSRLGSVLQPIMVQEMNFDESILTLESHALYAEAKNKVVFTVQALQKIVEWTTRYIRDEYLPKKALRVVDEVAVYLKNSTKESKVVTADVVAELLTQKLHIPISNVADDESKVLLNLENVLHGRVIGQDEAVVAVATALRRARAQVRNSNRPIASLLFVGPTGVGKTELCKALAQAYFGSENNMIRLDMSEYQTSQDIYKLIGSGSSESLLEGNLTKAIQKNPYSIVLLDEFEKAHPDVLNVFLQVMEDGRLSDARGVTADFTNAIVVATSNAATSYIIERMNKGDSLTAVKEALLSDELLKFFKPELINRFDNVVLFKPLNREDVGRIASLMIAQIAKTLLEKSYYLEVTNSALSEFVDLGFDSRYGARPMRRLMQQKIEDILAVLILEKKLKPRDTVIIDAGGKSSIKKAV